MRASKLRVGWLLAHRRPSEVGVHHSACGNGGRNNSGVRIRAFTLSKQKISLHCVIRWGNEMSVGGVWNCRLCSWALHRWKWKCSSLNRVQLLATPWARTPQAPLSIGFSRQEYGSGWTILLCWTIIPFSRGSSQPRDRTWLSCIAGRFFTVSATRGFIHVCTPVIGCFMHSVFLKSDGTILHPGDENAIF